MKKAIVVLVAGVTLVVAIAAIWVFVRPRMQVLHVEIPEYQKPGTRVVLEQGWSPEKRIEFWHTAQGTQIMPYKWFLALEQPSFWPFRANKLADKEYLGRFGFIADDKMHEKWNPDGLPIGFAVDNEFRNPVNGHTYAAVGFTCAACHTAELHYGNHAVLVEGGPAMLNVGEFLKAVGNAMILTDIMPFRYARFEKNVLGPDASANDKRALRQEFTTFLRDAIQELNEGDKRGVYNTMEGFGRTDALARIGNIVFALDMNNWENLAPTDAPVRYPQIWDVSWFTLAQYNASISNPMSRNIGEALGVKAVAKLHGCCADKLQSTVRYQELWDLEKMIAGEAPYEGLTSPKWPDVFPPLDQAKVARGKTLYKQHCEKCHLPPVEELKVLLERGAYPWVKVAKEQPHPFLKNEEIPLDEIGTDPNQALNFYNRYADSGDLKKGGLRADEGLDYLTRQMALKFYNEQKIDAKKQKEMSGWQDPKNVGIRATKVYRARPLNGVWSLGTYLHNGSVPNLYELLSPHSERSAVFWVGSRTFDPKKVGYESSKRAGLFRYDVSKSGNSNRGHEFNGDGEKKEKGVIGQLLSPDDRWALIEYLKSL